MLGKEATRQRVLGKEVTRQKVLEEVRVQRLGLMLTYTVEIRGS